MAVHKVTHCCGHTVFHNLFGKFEDREKRAEWLEDQLCPDCWKKQRQEKIDAENSKFAAANAEAGLPPLTGTPKQIAWAETIRADMVNKMDAAKARYPEMQKQILANPEKFQKTIAEITARGFESVEDSFEYAVKAIDRIKQETAASWFINHRNDNIGLLIMDVAGKCLKNGCKTI